MNEQLHLEIVTPFGEAFAEEVNSCVVPGVNGQFQILKNHAAVLSSITTGAIKVQTAKDLEKVFATSGGFCEVRDNKIKIIVESAEEANSISLERAEKAKIRAEERIKNKVEGLDELRAKLALGRAINRIKVANYSK